MQRLQRNVWRVEGLQAAESSGEMIELRLDRGQPDHQAFDRAVHIAHRQLETCKPLLELD